MLIRCIDTIDVLRSIVWVSRLAIHVSPGHAELAPMNFTSLSALLCSTLYTVVYAIVTTASC